MNIIKNIHLLTDIVKPGDIDKLEKGALMHRRYGNITFKIKEVTDNKAIIEVRQEKSAQENYQPAKRLVEIVHETFDKFLGGRKINVGTFPYSPPGPDQVTHEWIVEKMKSTGTRLKKIADESGIDYPYLAKVVNGATLSAGIKAFFWYYFLSKPAA